MPVFPRTARAFIALAAAFILQGTIHAAGIMGAVHADPVNAIIGDRSFIERFGRAPAAGDPEALRITTHLAYVERLLRARDVSALPADLRAERMRNLDRLHAYRLTGIFPHNDDYPGMRRPCFIDRSGAICAVGYLVEQSDGRTVAEAINQRYQYAAIHEMHSRELAQWLERSGLTADEAAMIQPGYYTPPTIFLAATGGVTVAVHSSMGMPDQLRGTVEPAGTSLDVNPMAAVSGVFFFDRDESWQSGIIARVGYDNRSISVTNPAPDNTYVDSHGQQQTAKMTYDIDADYKLFTASLTWLQRINETPLLLLAGPSLGARTTSRRLDAYVPEQGMATAYESPAKFAPLRLGFTAGVQYELVRHQRLWIVPSITCDFGLTNVREGDSWRADAIQIGIDVRLPLNQRIESVGDGE